MPSVTLYCPASSAITVLPPNSTAAAPRGCPPFVAVSVPDTVYVRGAVGVGVVRPDGVGVTGDDFVPPQAESTIAPVVRNDVVIERRRFITHLSSWRCLGKRQRPGQLIDVGCRTV
jgi:hypothetical protein